LYYLQSKKFREIVLMVEQGINYRESRGGDIASNAADGERPHRLLPDPMAGPKWPPTTSPPDPIQAASLSWERK
jgi:hypothetical protein